MTRLIAVQHQIPFRKRADGQGFDPEGSHHSQFAGIESLRQIYEVIYVGFSPETFTKEEEDQLWTEKATKLVHIDPKLAKGHYEGYCKSILWPLFHYILWEASTDGSVERSQWEHYRQVNEIFAKSVAKIYQPGDVIWIQDYHLMLLPSLIKKLISNVVIGLFLHTPFPSSEVFRCLPRRKEVLLGLLGANLVGFQTYAHARHFISACTRIVGCESTPSGVENNGFHTQIGIFPMGIDLKRTQTYLDCKELKEKIGVIRELFKGKRIIVGRDTMDHTKGVEQKLNAFSKFLEKYPQWKNQVALVQISSPGSSNSSAVQRCISDLISKINGMHGSLEYVPIHHYHYNLDPEEYYALLSLADVALITPLRDGMNTTSHDYIACQAKNHGVVILSEFTGSAGAMAGALLVNPWDVNGLASAINDALMKTPQERKVKFQQLYQFVICHTAELWAGRFVDNLTSNTVAIPDSKFTPYLDFKTVKEGYNSTNERLILLDYDGTLTPIVKFPHHAIPSEKILAALSEVLSDEKNIVYIISGRDQVFLDSCFGHLPRLGLSAEHGSFIKHPNGKWINLAKDIDLRWKKAVQDIFDYYTERTTGSFVETKEYSITWHYRLADPDYGTFQANECRLHLENSVLSKLPVDVMVGKKNLEVRPSSMNKGEIVKKLCSMYSNAQFLFCAGDDRTDEDMFQALQKYDGPSRFIFTCTIGSSEKRTRASSHVNSPEEIISLLHDLAFGI